MQRLEKKEITFEVKLFFPSGLASIARKGCKGALSPSELPEKGEGRKGPRITKKKSQ